MNDYYTYAFLRKNGTPYYIGKGRKNRIYDKRGRPCRYPPDKSRVIFLKKNLSEEEAFKHEVYMIFLYGRKDLGEGILQNKSNGGEGASGRIPKFETRKKISESKIGKNNPSYGKTGEEAFHYGKCHSEETKNKLRELNTGEKSHRYGKKHSQETKEKMSQIASGKNNPMYGKTGKNNPNYGKPLSNETKNKLSIINKNKIWITNGVDNYRVDKHIPIPEGFRRGITCKEKRIWITNGKDSYQIKEKDIIPEGFRQGRTLKKRNRVTKQ
jgi:hypothetical protein